MKDLDKSKIEGSKRVLQGTEQLIAKLSKEETVRVIRVSEIILKKCGNSSVKVRSTLGTISIIDVRTPVGRQTLTVETTDHGIVKKLCHEQCRPRYNGNSKLKLAPATSKYYKGKQHKKDREVSLERRKKEAAVKRKAPPKIRAPKNPAMADALAGLKLDK